MGIPARCQKKAACVNSSINVVLGFPLGVGSREPRSHKCNPGALRCLNPSGAKPGATHLMSALAISAEIFNEGIISAQWQSAGASSERCQFLPGVISEEPGRECRFLFVGLSANQEPIGLADMPIVVPQALSAGAFAAKTFNPHALALVKNLHPILGSHGIRIIASARVPDRKEHHLVVNPA